MVVSKQVYFNKYIIPPITPDPIITIIGFGFHLRNINNEEENNITDMMFIELKFITPLCSPKRARVNIDTPADAIRATTAGRSPDNTPCITSKSLYFI